MAPRNRIKIGDAAAAIGVTPQTLRYYEELGLLAPQRTPGGTRSYAPADLDRLRAIHRLVRLETPLATLARLARSRASSATGDAASRQVFDLLTAMAADVAERRAALEALSRELEAAQALVQQCFGCAQPPTAEGCADCAVADRPRPGVLRDIVWPEGA